MCREGRTQTSRDYGRHNNPWQLFRPFLPRPRIQSWREDPRVGLWNPRRCGWRRHFLFPTFRVENIDEVGRVRCLLVFFWKFFEDSWVLLSFVSSSLRDMGLPTSWTGRRGSVLCLHFNQTFILRTFFIGDNSKVKSKYQWNRVTHGFVGRLKWGL